MTQTPTHAKFRWTENLTCRFIQLRKDNGKLFTGRKYSAQAGWEYILQQMREEFPAALANVQYRVLKKKWSNLLQQYKELKNPVHGDRNKADDVSWPFYNAIDEVVGLDREKTPSINDDFIDPHKFLCVSVTPEEPTSSADALPLRFHPGTVSGTCDSLPDCRKIKKPRSPLNSKQRGRNSIRRKVLPRLPRATELIIEEVTSAADSSEYLRKVCGHGENEIRPRKSQRSSREARESRTDRCIEEIFEYMKRRDEENRSIIVRLMHAVESIANKL